MRPGAVSGRCGTATRRSTRPPAGWPELASHALNAYSLPIRRGRWLRVWSSDDSPPGHVVVFWDSGRPGQLHVAGRRAALHLRTSGDHHRDRCALRFGPPD